MPQNQEKAAAIWRLQEKSLETLDKPEVQDRLGHTAMNLSRLVEKTKYMDTDEQGRIEIGSYEQSRVPVVALHMGEHALLGPLHSGMNDRQVRTLVRAYGHQAARVYAHSTEGYFREANQSATIDFHRPAAAYAHANSWRPVADKVVFGRPFVAMNMGKARGGELSPLVFLHEMTHVLQKEREPIVDTDERGLYGVRNELEAFYVASQVVLALTSTGEQHHLLSSIQPRDLQFMNEVERIRQTHGSVTDPFEPNEALIEQLALAKLGVTPTIRAHRAYRS